MPVVKTEPFDLARLDTIVLTKGMHASRTKGVCAMELAAWIAGEPHTDHPACVSPALGAFLRRWNDSVDDDFRQQLKPFVPRVIGTAGDGKEEARAWLATDWLVRVCAPAWLDLCKLTQHAMALRAAEEIRDPASAKRVQPLIDAARKDADAAGAAAWDAARAAAGAAAWDAARAAAWDAAGDAAGDAARAAARTAALDAARTAALDAARTAAWDAAWDAAWAAAWGVAGDAARTAARTAALAAAGTAALAAAGTALRPTVELLQASALELLDRMIVGEWATCA